MKVRNKSIGMWLADTVAALTILGVVVTILNFVFSVGSQTQANTTNLADFENKTEKRFEKLEGQYQNIATGQARIEQKVDDIKGALNIKHRDDR